MGKRIFAIVLLAALLAVPATASGDEFQDIQEETPAKVVANEKAKIAKQKKLVKKAKKLWKESGKKMSSGKLDGARKDVKKLKKIRKKAKGVKTRSAKLAKRYPDISTMHAEVASYYEMIDEWTLNAIGSFEEAEKNRKSVAAAANRLKRDGVVYSGNWRYTWYSQRVLPGYGLSIPGRHVGTAGLVMDGSGRVCVASSDLSRGTVISTPYGKAKVYDCGCPSGTIDVYTNW